ncbi:serine hydrolase [Spirosoma oryzicola]|uniref:serine hydrolase n=1 Tax=Spirosoma oryzicola TaxID=2898794 RepID=UPI001E425A2A|nr:serine hydrolase [Spirosoma oryzicola]UHG91232.1 class A beta-lactamase-related serine hydrolase [Spirosoma oryzicola]
MSLSIPKKLIGMLCALATVSYGQPRTDAFLTKLFATNQNPVFQEVIKHPDTYRLQLIYTRIDRDKRNKPSFTNYYFNVDSTSYFNPASTVKLPLALLSLEKLNNLKNPKVTKFTAMQIDSAYSKQTKEWHDETSKTGYPSIAHFIKKAFLVSDNDAYSRMYEFVGQREINRSLHAKGYLDTRITHRFVRMTPDENRHTNPVRFIQNDGTTIYAQPAAYNTDPFDFSRVTTLGKGYYAGDSLVHQPFDFTERNKLPLPALQQLLQSVLFPASVPAQKRFNLTPDDYQFLYQYLSQYPGETNYPKYDTKQYYDSYVKFFFMDSLHRQMPEGVRVFNKVGWAYGFMTDVSYVADFRHNVEYMLTATLYVNSDGILNDDKYEYDRIGHPFLYQLGQTIYQHELKRKRQHTPDLSAFRVPYEKRRTDDRPVIKDVDN